MSQVDAHQAQKHSSFPEWLVQRTSSLLSGHRATRRRFLAGSAVVGSALATAPVKFALRPLSAYDAVCGNDSACADGYSVFCCTINNGGNFCPSDTFVGGWWKADDSGFCCGGPRYYLDCNAYCGSGWQCSCEDNPSTCDHRRIACNQFRYGQCNLDIACYGPVVCRVITCTAPWVFDSACDVTSATDDNTTTQSAPCLPGNCPSAIIMRYSDLGGPGGFLGPQVTPEAPAPAGAGTWVEFANGAIYNVAPEGLHFVTGTIWVKFQSLGGPQGFLGYPTTDQTGTPDGVGHYNHFANDGSIYWNPQLGAWSIHGAIQNKWASLGWEESFLGYPVTDENGTPDGLGRYNHFAKLTDHGITDHGSIYWTPQLGAWSIHGKIRDKWRSLGWEESFLGYPTTDQTGTPDGVGQYNHFAKLTDHGITDHGSIYWTPQLGAWSIHGVIQQRWAALGWEEGPLGYPISDQTTTPDGRGVYNLFVKLEGGEISYHGGIYWTRAYGARPVYGAIFALWSERGREAGALGYPITGPRTLRLGADVLTYQTFEHGVVYVPTHGSAFVTDARRGQVPPPGATE